MSMPLLMPRSLRPAPAAMASRPRDGQGPQVYIETFGCQMNEYDTEILRAVLKAQGFRFTSQTDEADIVLFNTCAIRENAHNRLYGHLGEMKRVKEARGVVIGVLGCMAQNLKKELLAERPFIDVLVGPDGYRRLPDLLAEALAQNRRGMAVDLSESETYDDIVPDRVEGVNGWIAIMRGCDNFCAFCVVPYTRGRERSRDPRGILEEVRRLADQGVRQITLLGQNVNSYRSAGSDFAALLVQVADVPGIQRVRFMSPHPKDFPPALIEAVAHHPHVCRHIHLPLQSGSDRILDRMGRHYSQADFLTLVERIQRQGPIALTTDIICGFSGETDAEFQQTWDVLRAVEFQAAYVFKYSERKHTIAARRFPDDVPETVKGRRVNLLAEWQRHLSARKNRACIGQTVPVMVEGHSRKSAAQWMGHSESNVTVVWDAADLPMTPGAMVSVAVDDASPSTLFGHAVTSSPEGLSVC